MAKITKMTSKKLRTAKTKSFLVRWWLFSWYIRLIAGYEGSSSVISIFTAAAAVLNYLGIKGASGWWALPAPAFLISRLVALSDYFSHLEKDTSLGPRYPLSNKTIKDGDIAPWKDLKRFEQR